jgi:hypothetical protein
VVSRQQVQINGVPVVIHGSYDREVQTESDQPVAEMEVVVIIRGRMANKQFMQLISREQVRLDYDEGQTPVMMMTRVVKHSAVASGSGESMVYRHDILFQEFPESFERRRAERAAAQPVVETPRPSPRVEVGESDSAGGETRVTMATDPSSWGDAIKQLRSNTPRPRAYEEPLTVLELAAIETVLINLRMEALIQQLEEAGMLQQGAVDACFRDLLGERFLAEATPLVGERAAQQAAREMHPD